MEEIEMIERWTLYEVYGCTEEGKPIRDAIFIDLKIACEYAVAQYGKIHWNLPEIIETTFEYDHSRKLVNQTANRIEPGKIYYMTNV